MRQQKYDWMQMIPWLVDLATLIVLWLLLPTAVNTLQTPSARNVIYLMVVFALMCLGVLLIRRLKPAGGVAEAPQGVRPLWLALGVAFGAAVMTAMAFQFNYFSAVFEVDTFALGEGQSAIFFVFAPGAWLGTSLLYAAFLALPVTPTVAVTNGRYIRQAFLGLLCINSMFLFMVAQLRAVSALLGEISFFLAFPLALLLLLLLFAPPRLLYWRKQSGRLDRASFFLLTAVAAWMIG